MGAVRAAGKRAQQAYKLAMAIHVTRCLTGQVIPAYRAWHAGLTGPGVPAYRVLHAGLTGPGIPAYKVGHAGLTGLGSTCIQGRTCWPYGACEHLHTGYYMQALQLLGIPAYRACHAGLTGPGVPANGVGHAGCTGLGGSCIQGRTCWHSGQQQALSA